MLTPPTVILLGIGICFFGFVQGSSLVVYAPDTLFQYPPYNFTASFEQFAGLPAGSVTLEQIPNLVFATLIDPRNHPNPVPDIVIGINNIDQNRLPEYTFLPVTFSQTQFIDPRLYAQVSGFNLVPYEQGRFTIIGNKTRIGKKFDPSTLTLQSIATNPDLLRTLILQDPETGEMGSAFFLSTIAAFGDAPSGVVGSIPGSDWQTWWTSVLKYAHLEPDWNVSWDVFLKNESYSFVIGNELAPQYYSCQGITDLFALNLTDQMWYVVESLGIYNKTQNVTLAQQFVDWFLSPTQQTFAQLSDRMFPARNNVSTSDCYKSVAPNPGFTPLLNGTTIAQNWEKWNSEWHKIFGESLFPPRSTYSSGAAFCFLSGFLTFVWFLLTF